MIIQPKTLALAPRYGTVAVQADESPDSKPSTKIGVATAVVQLALLLAGLAFCRTSQAVD